jgi:hypothetical protein
MARSRKTEQKYLTAEEVSMLDKTHFPELRHVQSPDLLKLRKRLREMRASTETAPRRAKLLNQSENGNGAGSAESEGTGQKMRRDILAAAVKRVNREIERRRTSGIDGRAEDNPLSAHP